MTENGHWAVVDVQTLPISRHLKESLLAWQRHFEAHFAAFDRAGGWDDAAHADWYRDNAQILADRLRRAIPGAQVEVDLWPGTGAPRH